MWIWALTMFSIEGQPESWLFRVKPQTWLEYYVFTAIFGFFTGLNTIAGHELLHRKEGYNKVIGTFAYTKFFYTHFLDEHIKGHHRSIATPEDPATAPKDMSIYRFILRSVSGHVTTIFHREESRIERQFGSEKPYLAKLANNKMIQACLIHCLLAWSIYMIFGWKGLAHQMVYAYWGVVYLEAINYIQHYGLLRKKDEDGVYESINHMHSWNSVSTSMMFRI